MLKYDSCEREQRTSTLCTLGGNNINRNINQSGTAAGLDLSHHLHGYLFDLQHIKCSLFWLADKPFGKVLRSPTTSKPLRDYPPSPSRSPSPTITTTVASPSRTSATITLKRGGRCHNMQPQQLTVERIWGGSSRYAEFARYWIIWSTLSVRSDMWGPSQYMYMFHILFPCRSSHQMHGCKVSVMAQHISHRKGAASTYITLGSGLMQSSLLKAWTFQLQYQHWGQATSHHHALHPQWLSLALPIPLHYHHLFSALWLLLAIDVELHSASKWSRPLCSEREGASQTSKSLAKCILSWLRQQHTLTTLLKSSVSVGEQSTSLSPLMG